MKSIPECDTPVCECHELEDAMFIEKAPEYVRKLLDEVERSREENARLKQQLRRIAMYPCFRGEASVLRKIAFAALVESSTD